MAVRAYSFFAGVFYVLLGLAGFVPGLVRTPFSVTVMRNVDSEIVTPLIFGCLPATWATNLVHLLVGAAGIFAAVNYPTARRYCQGMAGLMFALVVMGTLPFGINTLWGFMPMSGGTLALHLITAPMAFYFGFVYGFDADEARVPGVA